LPPVSKLNTEQALYYFLSGYTAKIAGTEHGINEPQPTFSACFGKAFIPLHPWKYAELLAEKIKESGANVWLINTGWTGGPYGIGERIKLSYTRAVIKAVVNGQLNSVAYQELPLFNLMMPRTCPGVPDEILNPVKTWPNPTEYWIKANDLFQLFEDNYTAYKRPHAVTKLQLT